MRKELVVPKSSKLAGDFSVNWAPQFLLSSTTSSCECPQRPVQRKRKQEACCWATGKMAFCFWWWSTIWSDLAQTHSFHHSQSRALARSSQLNYRDREQCAGAAACWPSPGQEACHEVDSPGLGACQCCLGCRSVMEAALVRALPVCLGRALGACAMQDGARGPANPRAQERSIRIGILQCPVRFKESGIPKETTEKDQPDLFLETTGNLGMSGVGAGRDDPGQSR